MLLLVYFIFFFGVCSELYKIISYIKCTHFQPSHECHRVNPIGTSSVRKVLWGWDVMSELLLKVEMNFWHECEFIGRKRKINK